jgi:hypothetical protein
MITGGGQHEAKTDIAQISIKTTSRVGGGVYLLNAVTVYYPLFITPFYNLFYDHLFGGLVLTHCVGLPGTLSIFAGLVRSIPQGKDAESKEGQ